MVFGVPSKHAYKHSCIDVALLFVEVTLILPALGPFTFMTLKCIMSVKDVSLHISMSHR